MSKGPPIGTVLVVDDTPDNLMLLIDFLQEHDFRPRVATHGKQALRFAEAGQPDVILLDVVMPGMDGFETCGQLKENPATREIPVIFLSALSDTESIVRGFEAGGVDYISKPFHQEEVLSRVMSHVTISRQKKELADLNRSLAAEIAKKEQAAADLARSQRRLKEAQATAEIGSWERDLTTNRGNWSDHQYRLFGYEPGEVEGSLDLLKQHIHPDDLSLTLEAINQSIEKMRPYDTEYRYITRSGEIRHGHARGAVDRDGAGRPVRIHGTFQDITERKRLEIALVENREALMSERHLLESVLDALPDVVGIQAPDHTILRFNRTGYDLHGLGQRDVIGKKCFELLGRTDECDICAARKSMESGRMETVRKYVPELGKHLSCTSNPLFDADGRIHLIIEHIADITELEEVRAALEVCENRLRAAQR